MPYSWKLKRYVQQQITPTYANSGAESRHAQLETQFYGYCYSSYDSGTRYNGGVTLGGKYGNVLLCRM